MKTLKSTLLCVFLSGLLLQVQAQYKFSKSSASYQALSGSSTIKASEYPSFPGSYPVPNLQPRLKTFNKLMGDTLEVGANGFVVSLGPDRAFALDPFLAPLHPRDSLAGIYYQVSGSTGNRLLKIEWRNMGLDSNASGDFVNFQLWLYEADQKIEFHYGPSNVTSNNVFGGATGPSVIITLLNTSFSSAYYFYSLTGAADNPQFKNPGNGNDNIDGIPSSGTVYNFSLPAAGLAQVTPNLLMAYPNPVDQEGKLYLPGSGKYQLYNIQGLLLRQGEEKVIDMMELAPGIYFIQDESGSFQKIIRN